jgi:hypothetical protein
MPLALGTCASPEAAKRLAAATEEDLFPRSAHPDAAMSGLWLYFSCLDESHTLSQQIHTIHGSFWHGIMHRQEPDAWNSGYWFRQVGRHPIFKALRDEAAKLAAEHPKAGFKVGTEWDPHAFITLCDTARTKPGTEMERLALEIQRAEWQLLFDYCARTK